ncbi:Abscisic acid G-protein coupled receptor-domain-containing protein [Chytriomyces sp. MP71]|nr:Abscisic acid G-protein coupled receptor-domain-containing protein [Chytriomyces sp. MP71]
MGMLLDTGVVGAVLFMSVPVLAVTGRAVMAWTTGTTGGRPGPGATGITGATASRLFVAAFTLAVLVFETLLLDIGAVLPSASAAQLLWRTVLATNIFASLVLLPIAIGAALCPDWVAQHHRVTFAVIAWLASMYMFLKVTAAKSISNWATITGLFSIQETMTRISMIGVALMAILSGFGAVFTPYTSLLVFVKKVDDSLVLQKEREMDRTQDTILAKRSRLIELKESRNIPLTPIGRRQFDSSISSSSYFGEGPSVGGFMRRMIGSVKDGLMGNDELISLKNELKALESLLQTLNSDLEQLQYERNRFKASQTIQGQVMNLLGYGFSLYCIYKIITVEFAPVSLLWTRFRTEPNPIMHLSQSSINLLFHRHGGTDPITLGINLVLATFSSTNQDPVAASATFDVESSAQQLSFLFVGVLVASSVRGLVIQFNKVFRLVAGGGTGSSDAVILFFALIMEMYCLSLVLMMRVSLPPQYSKIISNVLGDVHFDFYQRWFDFIFLVSAFASFIFIYATREEEEGSRGNSNAAWTGMGVEPPLSVASRSSSGFFPTMSRVASAGSMDGPLGRRAL